MKLPSELSEWSGLLNLFPRDIAVGLGVMARRLSQVIGPLRSRFAAGEGEPDGYGGLTNRGTIERLLPTEWLLARELPYEFERRAVMSEHLYFEPRRIQPGNPRISAVLFDEGPSQLGGPRLAHLALLILLARRAESACASFYWGIVQEPDRGWIEGLDHGLISERFLNARTAHAPSGGEFDYWRQQTEALGRVEDRWVIGGKGVRNAITGSSVIEIMDEPVPDKKVVSVHIRHGAFTQEKQVWLDLPEESIAGRLLRDPFAHAVPDVSRSRYAIDHTRPIVFSRNSLKVAVGIQDGGLMVYSIANSPKAKIGRPRYFFPDEGHSVVGVEILKNRILCVTLDGDHQLRFHRFPERNNGRQSSSISQGMLCAPEPDRLCPVHFIRTEGKDQIVMLDAKGTLFSVDWPITQLTPRIVDRGVVAVECVNGSLIYVAVDTENRAARIVTHSGNSAAAFKLEDGATGMSFLGMTGWQDNGIPGLFAINTHTSLWTTSLRHTSSLLKPFDGTTVIGVLAIPGGIFASEWKPAKTGNPDIRPGLVVLSGDRKKVSVLSSGMSFDLFTSVSPISQIRIDGLDGKIAYVTNFQELIVYSLKRKADVMRVASGDIP
jgi:hypothetical protein